jgi:hypothetical protein
MPKLSTALAKLRWSLAQRGLSSTLRIALRRIRPAPGNGTTKPQKHPFDLQYGVDTSGLIGGGDLRSGHRHDVFNTAYYGMAPSRFRGAMQRWTADESHPAIDRYSFVDLGCGKGRAVLMASEYDFRDVVGVELHSGLAKTAQANVTLWIASGRAAAPIHIICQDAAEFVFPEGFCLLYLFHPFTAPVLIRVIERIETDFASRTGMLDVIYFNPEAGELLDVHPGFQRLWTGIVEMSKEDATVDWVASPDDICSIYRWVGHGNCQ